MDGIPERLMQGFQNEVLEAIAIGRPFAEVARLLCERAEALAPTAICTILAIDNGRLRPIAAPSLPQSYSDALDGAEIGPTAGSCGTAAYFGWPVEVIDIETDPLWQDYAALVAPLGLRACWSSPIVARDGRVVGTFAFYYRTRRGPSPVERLIVENCVHLCAIGLEHEEQQRRNHRLAYYDQLTGLPNRHRFNAMLDERLAGDAPSLGLILADIDNLKTINDVMGHQVGDRLIQEVAARLAPGEPGLAGCHLGGDEFALLVDPCADHDQLGRIARDLLARMRLPLACEGNVIVPRMTLGGVLYEADGTDAGTLCQNADLALLHAKETARGGYVAYRPGLRTSITRRIGTIREVDRALAEGRIVAHYQPLVRLDSAEIVGLEALARMRMPDGRFVAAGAFQDAFSDTDVACRLTDTILQQVVADMAGWLAADIPFHHVGINLAAADFARDDLEARITAAFGSAVPLRHLVLEVTERVLMGEPGNAGMRAISRLRARGMLVALDDFGTGFASLTHLLTFPVDVIKIDRSFIDRLLTDRPSAVIVEALIDIARKLDMRVVAEGIECDVQRARLWELGCRIGQGYLVAKAADRATTTRLLRMFCRVAESGPGDVGTRRGAIQRLELPLSASA
ncbi:hypothetical protein STVA_17310 [Allostella vacuolata]|nr:hypothetical protein STVA_17310 [Stella vacuolata]